MADELPLTKLVTVRSRFTRSISLARDWERKDALEGYILTPSGREVFGRLTAALRRESPLRAWSLTGPYGAGKSAFALFGAQVLGGHGSLRRRAREELKRQDPGLWKKLYSGRAPWAEATLCPILVTGTREPFEVALAAGLARALRQFAPQRAPRGLIKQVEGLANATPRGVHTGALVAAFEDALEFVTTSGGGGLLLIIDELGKFLEYAASHPDEGDVFILQSLAEAAARAEQPFLLLTILHQALDRYTAHISPGRRQEWAKVQGRFEDIAFEEPTDQVLRLLAQAIVHEDREPQQRALKRLGENLASEAWSLNARAGSLDKRTFVERLGDCMPLHPAVTLVLGPLFRRLAQNERSLFAFLASGERFGFQEFLRETSWGNKPGDIYRLDRLYDYVSTALGSTLFSHNRGKHWAEVQSALERLHDANPVEVRVAKAVGLLQALAYSSGAPASREFLTFALRAPGTTDDAINAAIAALESRSVIVYRRHADSYALWEGSDVDVERRVSEAQRVVDPNRALTNFLADLAPPRPLVARRHSLRTGTLRYFEACYADRQTLASVLSQGNVQADGRVIYCVPLHAEDRRAMEQLLQSLKHGSHPTVVGAVPWELFDLKELCVELACLRWISRNTPELAGDATARRELRARLAAAESRLSQELRRSYAPSGGDEVRCRWFHDGEEVALPSQRRLNEYLSTVCDAVYSATPIWRNELINRRALSSAAAAARRNLIEAMIEHQGQEALGIDGAPPERSMYESLLRAPGLHRRHGDHWAFGPPSRSKDRALAAVWRTVEDFFAGCEEQRQPIADLFRQLSLPPFGLKEGVLPILLAAALLYLDTEVALYEEGTFVPSLTIAVFERLLRSPDKFQVQACRISGPRAVVFQKYAAMLSNTATTRLEDKPKLLTVVRPLIKFVKQLPEYVSNTEQLSATAAAVLRAIREARQPDQLLFTDLPVACGGQPFPARGSAKPRAVETFFGTLRAALAEIQRSYPNLQADIGRLLEEAFHVNGPLAQARTELSHRARLISDLAVDAKLKSFVVRATDGAPDDTLWLESLAALLAAKPSRTWNDQDRTRFEVNLSLTARTFRHFEALAFEMERAGAALLDGDDQAMRVAVTVPNAEEVERVLRIPTRLSGRVSEVQDKIRRVLASAELLSNPELGAAALAQIVRQLLLEGER